jgi:hypothetical protein
MEPSGNASLAAVSNRMGVFAVMIPTSELICVAEYRLSTCLTADSLTGNSPLSQSFEASSEPLALEIQIG